MGKAIETGITRVGPSRVPDIYEPDREYAIEKVTELGLTDSGFGQIHDGQGTTLESVLASKQPELVSGTNIKTVNGQDILGNGDLPLINGELNEMDVTIVKPGVIYRAANPSYVGYDRMNDVNFYVWNPTDFDAELYCLRDYTNIDGQTDTITVKPYEIINLQGWYNEETGLVEWYVVSRSNFYQKPSSGIPKSDLASGVQSSLNKADATAEKVPDAASASNQLADKAYVNDTVQTNTANFRGNWSDWDSVPNSANNYPVDYRGSHTPTTNDYMVVADAKDYALAYENDKTYYIGDCILFGGDYCIVIKDDFDETDWHGITGKSPDDYPDYWDRLGSNPNMVGTWRFKYTGAWATNGKSGWQPEYQINEEPLTPSQLAAINSGITSTKVTKLDALPTRAELTLEEQAIDKVFVATYGTTTATDIASAIESGKLPVVISQYTSYKVILPLVYENNSLYIFGGVSGTSNIIYATLNKSNSSWSRPSSSYDVELTSRKTSELNSSSTNTQYPGAKVVYDELVKKQDNHIQLEEVEFTFIQEGKWYDAADGEESSICAPSDAVSTVISCFVFNPSSSVAELKCYKKAEDFGSDVTTIKVAPGAYIKLVATVDSNKYATWSVSSDSKEVFVATYGTTTAQEILDAYNAGKAVICKYEGLCYFLFDVRDSETRYQFSAITSTARHNYITVKKSDSSWSKTGISFETSDNKTSDISGNSTSTTKYPTTKGVVDYVTAQIQGAIDASYPS